MEGRSCSVDGGGRMRSRRSRRVIAKSHVPIAIASRVVTCSTTLTTSAERFALRTRRLDLPLLIPTACDSGRLRKALNCQCLVAMTPPGHARVAVSTLQNQPVWPRRRRCECSASACGGSKGRALVVLRGRLHLKLVSADPEGVGFRLEERGETSRTRRPRHHQGSRPWEAAVESNMTTISRKLGPRPHADRTSAVGRPGDLAARLVLLAAGRRPSCLAHGRPPGHHRRRLAHGRGRCRGRFAVRPVVGHGRPLL